MGEIIEAPEGKFLTQAVLKEDEQPIFVKKLSLATNSSAEDWKIVDIKEKIKYEKESLNG